MNNPRSLISPGEALSLVIAAAETLDPLTVAVPDACGMVLAEPIAADRDYPPFPRSMMDGFAVRLADAGQTLPIAGLLAAGAVWEGELPAGRCLEILTGAAVPARRRSGRGQGACCAACGPGHASRRDPPRSEHRPAGQRLP